MRALSAAIQTMISTNLGIEPVNILEVQWGDNLTGPWLKYADKDIVDYEFPISGKILTISNLESVVKLDNQGQTQGLSVTLSDTQGDLKAIFNAYDLHGKQCRFYQWFEGLPLSERFKLYEGEITSPIVWHEGERTLSFEVITKLADKEVGFSPEEGYFEFLPEGAYGKPWPLVFGKVQNVPAVLLSEIPNTQTGEPLGVVDPTLEARLTELREKYSQLESLFFFYAMSAGSAAFTCAFGDTADQKANACTAQEQYESMTAQIAVQMGQVQTEISELTDTLNSQTLDQNSTLSVINGSVFPAGSITLQSGNVRLQGSFSGDIFNIDSLNLTEYEGYSGSPFGFTWQTEGTTISIQSGAPIVYIINLLPSTVLYVSAYKQVENGKILSTVPQSWYTVKTEDIGSYEITYITFSKPLSSFDDTYEDKIYVSLESTVGPNTVDILEWFISTYTDMSVDSTTFDNVKTKLENYPSHFALLTRKNILSVLEEIAFQSRCAIWISGGIFYLRYLPEEQTEVATLTETHIDAGSLIINTSTTEDLVTKLVAKWQEDYAVDEKNQIILRHNVKKYGTREREIDFYIYNIFDLVLKSTTFWIIRLSNVWKHLDFSVYLDNLALETFDTVKFNFATDFVADSAIKGVLTSAIYDSAGKTINMLAWLPVKCGSMQRYDFAEPHDIDIDLLFPTQDEIDQGLAGGDGPGIEVESGFELGTFFNSSGGRSTSRRSRQNQGQRIQGRDYGEERPSDLNDTKPEPQMLEQSLSYKDEPIYNYKYPGYELEGPPIDEEVEYSFSLPGKILGQLGPALYAVNVYKLGLGMPPSAVPVIQLQIATDVVIPVDTWVLVAYNTWIEGTGEDQVTKTEYTMQVPVWL